MIQKKYNVTFIPLWLENVMSRSGINFTDALNPERLLAILSKNDIVFYLLAQVAFRNLYLQSDLDEHKFFLPGMSLEYFPNHDVIMDQYNIQNNIDQKEGLDRQAVFLKYAFGESAPLDNLKDATLLINANLIDDENIIFRLEFSEIPQEQYKINAHFYDQLLQILNYYYPLCDIAPSKMFLAYLQSIGKGISN